jgi:hypothetical protein
MTARRAPRDVGQEAPHVNEKGLWLRPWTWGAITGPFKQPERSFQRQVIAYAEIRGWRWYHVPDSRRSTAGFPDLVLVRRPRVVWAELKSQRGKATEDQRDWLDDLRASGQHVYLWRPSDWPEIEKVLR